jgi:hypothetical protein
MPRFFFHLYDSVTSTDEEGQAFRNAEAARMNAVCAARALIAAQVMESGEINLGHRIEVEDERGAIVAVLRFADVTTLRP